MPAAIGLRIYKISVNHRQGLHVDDHLTQATAYNFFCGFLADKKLPIQHTETERTWHFDDVVHGNESAASARIVYGTYGFESSFVEKSKGKTVFRRKSEHIENIPLIMRGWAPKNARYMLASFQSFGGKSCISLVKETMRKEFEENNLDYRMDFLKLSPTHAQVFADKKVKKLHFLTRNDTSDIADRIAGLDVEQQQIELTISCKRNGNLGLFGKVMKVVSGRPKTGIGIVIDQDGDPINLDEVMATIQIGGKQRRVSIHGVNSDAGVIEITEDVTFDGSGHPQRDSLELIMQNIMEDFNKILIKMK